MTESQDNRWLDATCSSLHEEYEEAAFDLEQMEAKLQIVRAGLAEFEKLKALKRRITELASKGKLLRNQHKQAQDRIKDASTTGERDELREAQSYLQATHDKIMAEQAELSAGVVESENVLVQLLNNCQVSDIEPKLSALWSKLCKSQSELGFHLEELQDAVENIDCSSARI